MTVEYVIMSAGVWLWLGLRVLQLGLPFKICCRLLGYPYGNFTNCLCDLFLVQEPFSDAAQFLAGPAVWKSAQWFPH